MKNYRVLTAIQGLRRADGMRKPIAEGEVIALPRAIAASITAALEQTDDPVTVELNLDPPAPPALIASDDVDGLIAAVRQVGGAARIIAAASVEELRAALDKLEPGADDRAVPELGEVSNFALATEVSARLSDGTMLPEDFPIYVEAVDRINRLTEELAAAKAAPTPATPKRPKAG